MHLLASLDADSLSDLETVKDAHFVFSIRSDGEDVQLLAVTSAKNGDPKRVHIRGADGRAAALPTRLIADDGAQIVYAIEFSADRLAHRTRFFLRKKDRLIRVLQPLTSTLQMPEGWGFSPYHLYLVYDGSDPDIRRRSRAFIRKSAVESDKLILEGALVSTHPIAAFSLEIRKFREESIGWEFSIKTIPAKRIWGIIADAYSVYRNEHAYKFHAEISLDWNEMRSSIYSVIVHADTYTTGLYRFNDSFNKKKNLFGVSGGSIFAFIDRNAAILRLEKYEFGEDDWPQLQQHARSPSNDKTIIIGEYTNSARDNGLHLFRYLQDVPDLQAFYVIESNKGLSGPNVVNFGSAEHVRRCLDASVVAFTHHPQYVVTHLADALRQAKPVKTVFLQHGVTAFKNSMDAYHFGKTRFDLFNVCSRREQSAVAKACSYPPDRVAICGFPRHDQLHAHAVSTEASANTILIFPTWRRTLDKVPSNKFVETEFHRKWSSLCGMLRSRGKAMGWRVVFVTHPIIARHSQLFNDCVDEMIDVEDIQKYIVACGCLVTDYSSIAIDAAFAGKPVYFFTFDAESYGFKEGAFVDVDTDLPGERHDEAAALVEQIREKWPCRGALDPQYESKLPIYFDYIDDHNCERMEMAIRQLAGW